MEFMNKLMRFFYHSNRTTLEKIPKSHIENAMWLYKKNCR